MSVNELISRYSISLTPDGKQLAVYNSKLAQEENAIPRIRDAKAEIIAELTARAEAAEQARKDAAARLAQNVPGLEELRKIRLSGGELICG